MSTVSILLAMALAAATPPDAAASAQTVQAATQAEGEPSTQSAVSAPASFETTPSIAAPEVQTVGASAASPGEPDHAAPDDGSIVVLARENSPADPLASINVQSYEVIQAVDEAFVGPVAMGYKNVMPKPLRLGLRNFLRNLEEPVIAFNYLLQLKPGRAAKSVGRFALNSTIGIGGLMDVAKLPAFNLPYTPNGFGNTFACYGIGPGPYFFLPLIGPTTLRDVIGVAMDRAALPAVIGKPLDRPYYAIPSNVVDSLNDRIDFDQQLNEMRNLSNDPYVAGRELYLKQRRAEIAAICPKKGQKPEQGLPPRPGKGRD